MRDNCIKCLVWDLDHTLWNGILLEDKEVSLRAGIQDIIIELDNRGILQSISSKNNYEQAMKKLKQFKLDEYFLYPQINWNAKSNSIKTIQKVLNFGMDTIAFVDDQDFEREEVSFSLPEVMCINASDINKILEMKEMNPRFVTEDSKNRRTLYMNDIKRNAVEEIFKGPQEEFLKTLNMEFIISKAVINDLKRMEELTVRTHQLNSTGTVYNYDELCRLINSDQYLVLVAELKDKYGEYGKIGISVIEKRKGAWDIKLLLMSCRVMSKGVGAVILKYIIKLARKEGVRLYADFVTTDKNRIMYITYKFNGFSEMEKVGDFIKFEADLNQVVQYPEYTTVINNIN